MTPIRITRAQLYPCVARPGPAWRWTYSYDVDGRHCQYGTGLASLRDMLKRKYPGRPVIESWKS